MTSIAKSALLFIVAGLLEIGGGYLVWLWLRNGRSVVVGVIGGFLLFAYGVVPTLQPAHFGRAYAAYGGVFVALSLLWGWWVDGVRPDRFNVIGSIIVLAGSQSSVRAPLRVTSGLPGRSPCRRSSFNSSAT